jgi:hypothetical protein
MNELAFVRNLKHFDDQDKLEIASCFKLKNVKAGHRLFEDSNEFNWFYLVLHGSIGIFYPD